MNLTDPDLVGRLLRGERAAFDQFFNEYYPKLFRFVKRRMPRDASGAEDVAQATLCRALESLRTYRGEAALMTWLCTLCRREMNARWQENRLYADVLEWKYVRDLSVADIAARLGRSAKATESLLTRARAAFRETFTLLRGDAIDESTS